MQITVIGAGAWGTALAIAASRQSAHRVVLHARDAAQAQALQQQRRNERYLPGIELPVALAITSGPLDALLQSARAEDLFIIATPMAGLRSTLLALQGVPASVAWLCKGFEAGTGLMPHEVQAQVAPQLRAGALNGPSFAQEVARTQPTALVAASPHASVREALVKAFHGGALRVYANEDIVGVEVGGAVKNVLAIATGLCDGLDLGLNARAALITRGLAEMTRLGVALGAKPETFMGLSGLAPSATPRRVISARPRVMRAARAFSPRSRPSQRPVAMASTFLTAPPTSTPTMSSLAYTRSAPP